MLVSLNTKRKSNSRYQEKSLIRNTKVEVKNITVLKRPVKIEERTWKYRDFTKIDET